MEGIRRHNDPRRLRKEGAFGPTTNHTNALTPRVRVQDHGRARNSIQRLALMVARLAMALKESSRLLITI